VPFGEHDLLNRIVQPRLSEHRPPLLLQRDVGDRADRFEERTAANVATASTSVPAPVASEEIVDPSSTDLSLSPVARARQAFDAPANGITC
jgi:hypothetical protein